MRTSKSCGNDAESPEDIISEKNRRGKAKKWFWKRHQVHNMPKARGLYDSGDTGDDLADLSAFAKNIDRPVHVAMEVDKEDYHYEVEDLLGLKPKFALKSKEALEVLPKLTITSKKFDPILFLNTVHKTTTIRDLKLSRKNAENSLANYDEQARTLVVDNFYLIFNIQRKILEVIEGAPKDLGKGNFLGSASTSDSVRVLSNRISAIYNKLCPVVSLAVSTVKILKHASDINSILTMVDEFKYQLERKSYKSAINTYCVFLNAVSKMRPRSQHSKLKNELIMPYERDSLLKSLNRMDDIVKECVRDYLTIMEPLDFSDRIESPYFSVLKSLAFAKSSNLCDMILNEYVASAILEVKRSVHEATLSLADIIIPDTLRDNPFSVSNLHADMSLSIAEKATGLSSTFFTAYSKILQTFLSKITSSFSQFAHGAKFVTLIDDQSTKDSASLSTKSFESLLDIVQKAINSIIALHTGKNERATYRNYCLYQCIECPCDINVFSGHLKSCFVWEMSAIVNIVSAVLDISKSLEEISFVSEKIKEDFSNYHRDVASGLMELLADRTKYATKVCRNDAFSSLDHIQDKCRVYTRLIKMGIDSMSKISASSLKGDTRSYPPPEASTRTDTMGDKILTLLVELNYSLIFSALKFMAQSNILHSSIAEPIVTGRCGNQKEHRLLIFDILNRLSNTEATDLWSHNDGVHSKLLSVLNFLTIYVSSVTSLNEAYVKKDTSDSIIDNEVKSSIDAIKKIESIVLEEFIRSKCSHISNIIRTSVSENTVWGCALEPRDVSNYCHKILVYIYNLKTSLQENLPGAFYGLIDKVILHVSQQLPEGFENIKELSLNGILQAMIDITYLNIMLSIHSSSASASTFKAALHNLERRLCNFKDDFGEHKSRKIIESVVKKAELMYNLQYSLI